MQIYIMTTQITLWCVKKYDYVQPSYRYSHITETSLHCTHPSVHSRWKAVKCLLSTIIFPKPQKQTGNIQGVLIAHFNYCPLVWHSWCKYNTAKLERLQERGLSFVHKDFSSSTYGALLVKADSCAMKISRSRSLAQVVYKPLNGRNFSYQTTLFQEKRETALRATTHYWTTTL